MVPRDYCPSCQRKAVIKIKTVEISSVADLNSLNDAFQNFMLDHVLNLREVNVSTYLCLSCFLCYTSLVFSEDELKRLYNQDYEKTRQMYKMEYCKKVNKTLKEIYCGSNEQADLNIAKAREWRPKFIYNFLEPYLDRKSIKILDVGGYDGHNITGFRGGGEKTVRVGSWSKDST